MKWVVLVIAVAIGLYTFLTLRYRKPGPSHRPYEEAQERVLAARLQEAGWSRVPVTLRRPAESAAGTTVPAAVTRHQPGLGPELAAIMPAPRDQLASADRIVAPAEIARGTEYTATFTGNLADLHHHVAGMTLYRLGETIVLIPNLERIGEPGLLSRWNDGQYELAFPTHALPPGRYRVRLCVRGAAPTWSFTVR